MTHEQYEVLSNQAVAACAVVYFLAVLAHLAQWAPAARSRSRSPRPVVRRCGRRVRRTVPPRGRRRSRTPERMELFGRIGVALTVVAAFLQFIALVAPRARRGPGAGAVGKHVRVHPDRHLGRRGRLPAALQALLGCPGSRRS